MKATLVGDLARGCGFELAGVAPAIPVPETGLYRDWVRRGLAGEMAYLTDQRAEARMDPRSLLPTARSVICVGKLYNGPQPDIKGLADPARAWISRYAWGEDYHRVLRDGLKRLDDELRRRLGHDFDSRICVDTAPLLERSYARQAGLGWIGKNTCLIHEGQGSWFFLGELLTSLDLEPDAPPPDRCGACTRCIDSCPTQAIVPAPPDSSAAWVLDSRLCISYFTIEVRGDIPEDHRSGIGSHVFGCDICQDVCPWNRRSPRTASPEFAARNFAPPLEELASLGEQEFARMFQGTPVTRARYAGFLRNVAVAMGNSGEERFRDPLERLARHPEATVAGHARWALREIESKCGRAA
jgi:epoxyqueuosine reductase